MVTGRDEELIQVAHRGAAEDLHVRAIAEHDAVDVTVNVLADGVMVGVRNVQKAHLHYRIDRPVLSFDPALRGAEFTRRFEALLRQPTSWVRREQFRRAVAAPPARRPDRVVFAEGRAGLPGRARVRACSVRVRGSRGVVIGNGNRQTLHLRYQLTRSQIAVESVLRAEPRIAYRLADFVATPESSAAERRLVDAMSRTLSRSPELTRMITAGFGRTGGVMIGTENRQTTTTRTRIRDVEVRGMIIRVRLEALESAARTSLAKLDSEDRRDLGELRGLDSLRLPGTTTVRRREDLETARAERARQCLTLQTRRLERASRPDSPHADRIPSIKAEIKALRGRIAKIAEEQDARHRGAVTAVDRAELADRRPTKVGGRIGPRSRTARIPRGPGTEAPHARPLPELEDAPSYWPAPPLQHARPGSPPLLGPAAPGR
ncbi:MULTISPECIES: hypothetical protein [Parafrankia]|uniref:hypothetical protein n=1 Tax=Parafrankia TaxID=2994362 RepID=UPI001042347F|nr:MULTISPECIES: hypothetical protein [Parafrankia]MBE3200565.1 hypothetical protein [Parafrankia sp. CH37]